LVPSRSCGDDFVWIGGPDEGFGMLVVIDNEAVDGGLKIDDALEDTALKAMLGQDGEEAFDSIEPTGRGRPVLETFAITAFRPGGASDVKSVAVGTTVNPSPPAQIRTCRLA
jgi:hypothetical protein